MTKRITKRERSDTYKWLMFVVGGWLIASPIKDYLSNNFSDKIAFGIGILIIVGALWMFN